MLFKNLYAATSIAIMLVLFVHTISCSKQPKAGNIQVLKGATLLDGTDSDPIENSVIVIKGDKIECAGTEDDCQVTTNAEVIDVSGKYITPGLIDAHVHFFQTGFFDSRPDAMDITETYPMGEVIAYQQQNPERYYNSYLCSGVTGVYDVGGMSWSVELQNTAEMDSTAPHVAAAGPLITPVPGAPFDLPSDKVLVSLDSKESGIKTVQYLSALGSTGIKLWQLRADDEEYMDRVLAVGAEAKKRDNKLIVHATTLNQAKAALQSGAKLLVHSVQDQEVDEEFLNLAKEQGTYYNPTLIVGSGYLLAFRAAAGIAAYEFDDPNRCVDAKTRELLDGALRFEDHPRLTDSFEERLQSFDPKADRVSETTLKNLKKVYDAGIPIVVGTDAGNPGTLHGPSIYEEMEAMQSAGIPAKDLVVMATRNGAVAMERGEDFGTLEAGKFANLIVLDENPSADISNMRSITHTMIKGIIKPVMEFIADKQ